VRRTGNTRGVSLIAAVFLIVVLAFLGAAFVTMITSERLAAVNSVQSMQALSIAEGGVEFEQFALAKSIDWYRASTDPIAGDSLALGTGNFSATVRVPATALKRMLKSGDATATVYTTAGFPASGSLQIGDDAKAGAEYVSYTVLNATALTLTARGQSIGGVATSAATFPRGTYVYPVSTLGGALANSCSSPASFTINANAKFLGAGTLDIEGEEIGYGGSSTSGGVTTLSGIRRCVGPTASASHAASKPVTPVLNGGASADMQSEVTSTGSVGAALRAVKKTVQR
jgi:hypothetical protein